MSSQELINDYERLLEVGEGYDVIIYAGENEDMKEIRAHSLILRARLQHFRVALSDQWTNIDGKIILEIPNISPRIFKIILRFIYCGRIDLMNIQGPEILELSMAADELNIQTLNLCIQEYLINHQFELLKQDPIEILEVVCQLNQHDTFKGLYDCFLETICEKSEIFLNSDNLIRLNAHLLELLLKRDDLLMNEIEIWDNLIKWCLAQHPSIQQDVNKWNKEEIEIMKSTLRRFIPLIRFNNISSEDFYYKLYPYKVILTEDLTENILAFHMMPNKELFNGIRPLRKPKYDTNIVTSRHFSIFASWIERKNSSYYFDKDIPYHFKLIYRASRDGNRSEVFYRKCNNKGTTIVVVKIKGSEQIFGGYNPVIWRSYGNYMMTSSFIFSFTNRKNIKTAKVGYESSINFYPDYGSMYGCYLTCNGEGNIWGVDDSFLRNYLNINIPLAGYVETDDYEVFQVTKKP
ncbi:BTB/POZ domain-containing protein [Rhizophagus irregularis DAOM 181602=DAOM 197198]|uniref:Uncharacterized protein n=2 Tax=Rhizophagus irregularis TaxID=588596 RepID=U9SYU3_RHIID|nr:hypothetical protein GLOIN_2v1483651 [Rhizophagus irregularis DAOM 181602=DAOM 197198]EXX77646.1 hypothetical protein RirG_021950 [Rhizophagus irregularis DAOM 197198w]POG64741.1 hypothetical protein GLOIN_2v1483651 [Rhizophagus irregularis DAOM 181602=DAOM 197198]GBC17508.1 BTB/POZ domain-containing protein [Rhizophagus irregularis DAOM 181602=DAOM 197198]|eukprot:XP_025171607.1 hypothetical protein GLOIN_2v1483651 [Rhizophagus irregularis DAOM 181602=DAOM 197198]